MDTKDKFLLFLFLKFRNKKLEFKTKSPTKFNFFSPQKKYIIKYICNDVVYI